MPAPKVPQNIQTLANALGYLKGFLDECESIKRTASPCDKCFIHAVDGETFITAAMDKENGGGAATISVKRLKEIFLSG
jgi:hypothetical protein